MKFSRLAAVASAVVFAGAAMPAAAATLEVISGPTGQRAVTFPAFGPVGQSFTAFDSQINSVGFQFNALNPSATNTPFSLSLLAGSTLSGPALFTTSFTLPTSINSLTATWFDVAVSNWAVTTGQSYTLVLSTSSARNGIILGPEINIFNGQVLGGDAYAGGTALFTSQPYQGFCQSSGICDLNFRVSGSTPSVPEPASWALMIGGLGLAGAAMRRAKTRAIAFV
jgi:hypothetical protein